MVLALFVVVRGDDVVVVLVVLIGGSVDGEVLGTREIMVTHGLNAAIWHAAA